MSEAKMSSPDPRGGQVGTGVALVILLVAGTLLRLWRVRLGLPDFLEEAIPFRIAMTMRDAATGHINWNPHSFNYPSLSIYLHLFVQQVVYGIGRLLNVYHSYSDFLLAYDMNPTAMVVPARIVGVLCDGFALVAVYRLAERLRPGAGVIAGCLIGFSPILVTTSHSIFCDSLMGALAAWALERMVAWHHEGGRSRLLTAALLIGLAAGAKYPAAVLLLPLALLVWDRERRLCVPAWLLAVGASALVFLATTPFALLDASEFWRDFSFEGAHATGGHFGSLGHTSLAFHAMNLATNVGWAGVALLIGSLSLLARRDARRAPMAALWTALLGFGTPISFAHIDADRYLVPVILIAAAIIGAFSCDLLERVPLVRRRWAVAALSAVLVLPALVWGVRSASGGSDTTQAEAKRWMETHIGANELLVQEGYAAPIRTRLLIESAKNLPEYRLASPQFRQQLDAARWFHEVSLPLAVSGRVTNEVRPSGRPPLELEVVAHASELNRVFYEPGLYAGADYFVTSSAVRARFEADRTRYPTECQFYQFLDAHADTLARFAPSGSVVGPELRVYRISSRYRDELQPRAGLSARWWTAAVPGGYRETAQHALDPGAPTGWGGADTSFTVPPAWAQSLAGLYAQRVQPLVANLANEYAELGRNAEALALARATLTIRPGDGEACIIYSVCAGRIGRWREARAATERALQHATDESSRPALLLLHARTLAQTGDATGAMHELNQLVAHAQASDPIAGEARRMIAKIAAGQLGG